MKFFLALVLLSAVVAMTVADEDDDIWGFYKASFGRKHGAKEGKKRANFIARHRAMQKHNKENKKWSMGHNKFSDMDEEEIKVMFGAKPSARQQVRSSEDAYPILDRAAPTSLDYRTDTCLQAVKDQGQCGSCWTFATITPLEFNQCKKTNGTAVRFSEQMLVDCDTTNHGCNGGMYTSAWNYLKTKVGPMKDSAYPYVSGTTQAAGTSCKYSSTAVAAKVGTFNWVTPYDATLIRDTLVAKGPLPSAIKILPNFMSYAGGIYQDVACTKLAEGDIDHAIVIVGYGTDATTATDYWIVRNSWGTSWGIKGYFLIKRGDNMCNIEAWAAYVTVA